MKELAEARQAFNGADGREYMRRLLKQHGTTQASPGLRLDGDAGAERGVHAALRRDGRDQERAARVVREIRPHRLPRERARADSARLRAAGPTGRRARLQLHEPIQHHRLARGCRALRHVDRGDRAAARRAGRRATLARRRRHRRAWRSSRSRPAVGRRPPSSSWTNTRRGVERSSPMNDTTETRTSQRRCAGAICSGLPARSASQSPLCSRAPARAAYAALHGQATSSSTCRRRSSRSCFRAREGFGRRGRRSVHRAPDSPSNDMLNAVVMNSYRARSSEAKALDAQVRRAAISRARCTACR